MKVEIFKSRTGCQGVWNRWEYLASIDEKYARDNMIDTRRRWHLNDHKSLDSLAEQLATFPNAIDFHLIKGDYRNSEGVSGILSGKIHCLTQYGTMSDEEMGILGVLLWQYVSEVTAKCQ